MRTRTKKILTITAVSVSLAVVVFQAATFRFFGERELGTGVDRTIYTVPQFSGTEVLILLFGDLLSLILGITILVKRKWIGLFSLVVAIVSPVGLIISAFDDETAHTVTDTWRSQDGTEYAVLEASFLQGRELLLGERNGASSRAYKVLGRSTWEPDYGALQLVRPVGFGTTNTRILHKGGLLLVIGEGYLWVAYDLAKSQSYGDFEDLGGRVQKLSPFLLLGPKDRPDESDFDKLMDPKGYGRPPAEAIEPELKNPNPQVREMAKQLLKSVKDHPPQIQ